ncbi:MAG TPA: hypothetical protein VIH87_04865 [Methylocella sp.]
MKTFFFGRFPFPWYLSLVGTWLVVTTLYVLAALVFQSPAPSALVTGMSLLVPFNFSTAFAAYGGFLLLLIRPHEFPAILYVWAIVPTLTLILILGADWFMHKIGIPRTFVKILFNLIFLLLLTLLVNFALWQAWIPPEISI